VNTGISKRSDLLIESPHDGFCIVRNPGTGKYFRLGVREAGFLEQLRGDRPVEAIVEQRGDFTREQVDGMLTWFGQHGLLHGEKQHDVEHPRRGLVRGTLHFLMHSDQVRVKLANPDAILTRHRRAVDAMFSRPALALYLLAFLAPIAVYIAAPEHVRWAAANYTQPATVWMFLSLYLLFAGMVFCHEMAHAAACKHFGGRVYKIGLMFFFFNPVIYCDVSDSWRFRNSNHKVAVAAAGIFFQFVLGSIAVVCWMLTASSLLGSFAIMCFAVGVFNFFPLVKLDGYWMLVHALDEPNLRTNGFKSVDRLVRRALGRPVYASKPSSTILAYGLGAVIAVPAFWFLGLSGVYRYGSKVSPTLGLTLVCVLAVLLAYRALTTGLSYWRSLGFGEPRVARS